MLRDRGVASSQGVGSIPERVKLQNWVIVLHFNIANGQLLHLIDLNTVKGLTNLPRDSSTLLEFPHLIGSSLLGT